MPHSSEAEKALLGSIFVNNRAYETVSDFLKPEHFAFPQHGKIFEASAKLIERGQVADPVTLKQFFKSYEDLAEIGGLEYLEELATSAVTVITAEEYGRIILELFLRRDLIALGIASKQFMLDLVDGRNVRCELTGAKTYDRLVAACYLDDEDIGAAVISEGLALDCPLSGQRSPRV
jgi:replicative DNA helicase